MMATSDDGSSRWYFWGMTFGQPTIIAIVNATNNLRVNQPVSRISVKDASRQFDLFTANNNVSQVFAASSPPNSIHRLSFSLQSEK